MSPVALVTADRRVLGSNPGGCASLLPPSSTIAMNSDRASKQDRRQPTDRRRVSRARERKRWERCAAGTQRWRGRDCREGRRGRGRDCREEDVAVAGGGWSGGTVRVVDALAPALRCSRDLFEQFVYPLSSLVRGRLLPTSPLAPPLHGFYIKKLF
jgi:hypothetical protein